MPSTQSSLIAAIVHSIDNSTPPIVLPGVRHMGCRLWPTCGLYRQSLSINDFCMHYISLLCGIEYSKLSNWNPPQYWWSRPTEASEMRGVVYQNYEMTTSETRPSWASKNNIISPIRTNFQPYSPTVWSIFVICSEFCHPTIYNHRKFIGTICQPAAYPTIRRAGVASWLRIPLALPYNFVRLKRQLQAIEQQSQWVWIGKLPIMARLRMLSLHIFRVTEPSVYATNFLYQHFSES